MLFIPYYSYTFIFCSLAHSTFFSRSQIVFNKLIIEKYEIFLYNITSIIYKRMYKKKKKIAVLLNSITDLKYLILISSTFFLDRK